MLLPPTPVIVDDEVRHKGVATPLHEGPDPLNLIQEGCGPLNLTSAWYKRGGLCNGVLLPPTPGIVDDEVIQGPP